MATVPFEYGCNVAYAFAVDPNEHPRVGWVTALDGFGLPPGALKADLTLTKPTTGGTVPAVGVLERFFWGGDVGDPLILDFYVSQENATQIKTLQQMALKTDSVSTLGWWIADYDPETKLWFEQSFPMSPTTVSGTIQGKDNPALDVDLAGAPMKDGADVMVYKVTIGVVPAANQQFALHFANSAQAPLVKAWGLQVGTLAATDIPPAT
jgi:hypothetical protein